MAQNLYREWFVNFRFPGHENVKLVESPLGMIPQGWEVTTLDKIITIKSGFPFKRDIYDEDGPFGVVTIKNVQDGFFEKACTNRINKIPPKFPDYCYLKDGDVLISLTGNIGRVCLVCGNNLLLNQRVGKFIPQNIKNITFLYMMFRQKEMQEQLGTISNGVAQQNLSPVETGKLKILSPSSELIDNYLELSNPIFKQILLLIKKNDNLRQTRDLLLPKLISGEIDVSDLDIKVREPA
jgi:type I restriction enzyme S subunit